MRFVVCWDVYRPIDHPQPAHKAGSWPSRNPITALFRYWDRRGVLRHWVGTVLILWEYRDRARIIAATELPL